jgi:Xaa-Pro aminopeptidase
MDRRQEIEEKTERVIRFLAEKGLGGMLISSQHNFAWLTGGGRNGIDTGREAGAGALFIRRDGRRFVLANRIEMPRLLAEELAGQEYEPVEFDWERERANPSFMLELALRLLERSAASSVSHLGSVSNLVGTDLWFGGGQVLEAEFARLRYQLTDSEIERLRALGRDAGQIVAAVARSLVPGLSELEVARRTAYALAAGSIQALVMLVAADERLSRFRHPVPTDRRWEKVVMIVVGARRGGLIASLSRIVCAGPVPDDLRRKTEATARVGARLLAATKPGVMGSDLYRLAARAYADEGFPGEQTLHHQGGATGYRTRDWVAHPTCQESVQPRQAFAWNPSITGTKVEETCIAFDDEIELITSSPGWPQIKVELEGQPVFLPDVLSL